MNNQPPSPGDIPPQPSGYGPPPPPPPPPGYGSPPPGYGGQQQAGHGAPPPGYGAPPPNKRPWLPWALGCGGCGLLIVLALVFFGAIGYFADRNDQTRGVMSDSTVVDTAASFGDDSDGTTDGTEGSGDSIAVIQPLDTETSSDEGAPSDDGSSRDLNNKPGLQEIRPVEP